MTKNKTFIIQAQRLYRVNFEYEAKSIQEIENMINWNTGLEKEDVTDEMCEDLWDVLSEKELEEMDVDTIEYEIYEKGKETRTR